jgi:hypothetical protein
MLHGSDGVSVQFRMVEIIYINEQATPGSDLEMSEKKPLKEVFDRRV